MLNGHGRTERTRHLRVRSAQGLRVGEVERNTADVTLVQGPSRFQRDRVSDGLRRGQHVVDRFCGPRFHDGDPVDRQHVECRRIVGDSAARRCRSCRRVHRQRPAHQVTQGRQPAADTFEHRDAVVAQPVRRGAVDRRGNRRQHRYRRVGARGHVQHGIGVRGVAVELGDQIDGQRRHPDPGIVGHCLQAGAEQVAGVGAGPPYVQRIGRQKTVVQ